MNRFVNTKVSFLRRNPTLNAINKASGTLRKYSLTKIIITYVVEWVKMRIKLNKIVRIT